MAGGVGARMRYRLPFSYCLIASIGLVYIFGCGHHDGGEQFFDEGQKEEGQGPRPMAFSIDLSNAANLAITDASGDASQSSVSASPTRGLILMGVRGDALEDSQGADGSSNMTKVEKNGDLSEALVDAEPLGMDGLSDEELKRMGPPPTRPRVAAIGIAPTGEIYVLFENSFLFRMVEETDGLDPWSPTSPYTCQLFRAELNIDEALVGETVPPLAPSNLQCLTTDFEIPTWRQGQVMQFDGAGNLYFPVHISGTDQDLFYSYDPKTQKLTEVVNANICWANVEVTPAGSVFYTGTTKTDNDCGGTSFFRYVSNENRLIEISRNWWDYAFTTELNPDNPEAERILFYGPDPDTSNGMPSWDTACLYRYDPEIDDPEQRATRLAKCLNDVWGWVDARELPGNDDPHPSLDLRLTKKQRCESDGQAFIGGSGISRLEQGNDGKVYMLGELQRKLGGEFKCSIEITVPHCSSLDPTDDETSCLADGFSWVDEGWCEAPDYYPTPDECSLGGGTWFTNSQWYDSVEGAACIVSDSASVTLQQTELGAIAKEGWRVQWTQCSPPNQNNGQWTQTVRGMAYLNPNVANPSENLPILISALDEDAINFWLFEREGATVVYYTSFRTGRYVFTEARLVDTQTGPSVERRTLLEEYEVYNVSPSPNHPTRLMFDSLYFPTNTYRFGSIDVGLTAQKDIEASFEVTEGLTGKIRTLIVLPE